MNVQEKWIIDALNWLIKEGKINEQQCRTYIARYKSNPQDFETIKQELTALYNSKPTKLQDDIEIIDVQEETPNIVMQSKGKQKTLGTNPLYKKAGFMNMLFFIFLTGIGSGIILMIILNLLAK